VVWFKEGEFGDSPESNLRIYRHLKGIVGGELYHGRQSFSATSSVTLREFQIGEERCNFALPTGLLTPVSVFFASHGYTPRGTVAKCGRLPELARQRVKPPW